MRFRPKILHDNVCINLNHKIRLNYSLGDRLTFRLYFQLSIVQKFRCLLCFTSPIFIVPLSHLQYTLRFRSIGQPLLHNHTWKFYYVWRSATPAFTMCINYTNTMTYIFRLWIKWATSWSCETWCIWQNVACTSHKLTSIFVSEGSCWRLFEHNLENFNWYYQ